MSSKTEQNLIDRRLIVKSKISPKCLFIFRVLAFAWSLTHWILSLVNSGAPKFLASIIKYMTLWGLQLTVVYFAWSLFWGVQPASVSRHFSSFNHNVFTTNFFVTVFYFAVLFKSAPMDLNQYVAIVNHSTPFLLILIETVLNNSVFYWYNYCKYLWLFAVYMVVNMVFSLVHKPVYNVMDFKSVKTLIYLLVSAVLTIMGHCVGMLVQVMFKHLVYQTVRQNQYEVGNGVALTSGKEITQKVDVEGQYLTDQKEQPA